MGIPRISFASEKDLEENSSSLDPYHSVPCPMEYMDNTHNISSLPFLTVVPTETFVLHLNFLGKFYLLFVSNCISRHADNVFVFSSMLYVLATTFCGLAFSVCTHWGTPCSCLQALCHTCLTILILLYLFCSEELFCWSYPALLLSRAISNNNLKIDPEQKKIGSFEVHGYDSKVLFLSLFSVAHKLHSFIFMFAVTKTVLNLYITCPWVAGSMEHVSYLSHWWSATRSFSTLQNHLNSW